MKPDGTWFGINGWPTADLSQLDWESILTNWPLRSIGLRCDGLLAIDADIEDPALVALMDGVVKKHLGGVIPVRGRSNSRKRFYLCTQDGSVIPSLLKFLGSDSAKHGIDLLAGPGRQFVVTGQHPSGAMYECAARQSRLESHDNLDENADASGR